MVTGVRQDAYSNAHRVQVEVDKKPEEKGKYIHPIEFGKPANLGIRYDLIQKLSNFSNVPVRRK
jgi:hypothetical protein